MSRYSFALLLRKKVCYMPTCPRYLYHKNRMGGRMRTFENYQFSQIKFLSSIQLILNAKSVLLSILTFNFLLGVL